MTLNEYQNKCLTTSAREPSQRFATERRDPEQLRNELWRVAVDAAKLGLTMEDLTK